MTHSDEAGGRRAGSLLERILESKREEIAASQAAAPLDELRSRAADTPPARDFRRAVVRPGTVRLIAEIKKASPSKGLIRADFDPVAIARSYVSGGAAAISVLTDGPFFQGSLEIFRAVREAVDLPLLRKEFMIDAYQFYEARAAGADAALLITSILSDGQLADFHGLAGELGMAALLETHSEQDVRRAMGMDGPFLLGINNRDLHDPDLRTDLAHAGRMIPRARDMVKGGGSMPPIVSESGIHTAQDVGHLDDLGVAAVLVGEALMRRPDPGEAARDLMA